MNASEFQNTKIELAKMILNIESEALLNKVRRVLFDVDSDWWEDLTEIQKEDILQAKREIQEGKTISLNEFIKKIS
jgi:hypothetical protein